MSWMFYKCSSLKELNLNNFKTNNVTNMYSMFSGCSDDLKIKLNQKIRILKMKPFIDND